MPKTKIIEEKSKILKGVSLYGSDVESKRQEIIEYFNTSYSLYDELFSFISDEGFYIQAESLRHPLIFYLGHTATFIINKLIISGAQIPRINPDFESKFAVGVDEMSWDDINQSNYSWPSVNDVKDYRKKARKFFNEYLEKLEFNLPINWENPMWIAFMIAEHEKIHLETSAVIMRRLPLEYFKKDIDWNTLCEKWNVCEEKITDKDADNLPKNEFIEIKGTEITIGKEYTSDYYGWDVEYGRQTTQIKDFFVGKYLITNREYLEFMSEGGGYSKSEYWTEEGVKWLRFQTFNRPVFWSEDHTKLRLFHSTIPMPWDWPVEVNYLEAKAYCNWLTQKTGKYTRLLTEPEWYLIRGKENEFDSNSNINFNHFASSCPVNKFKQNFGVYDTFGNVWQHTETAVDEFEDFKVYPAYKDFSLPTFDGMHNCIKGGSWISTGNLSLKDARYAFRRHFYQFAGFRCVQGEEEIKENVHVEKQPDVTRWISSDYEMEMYEKFKIKPALKTVAEDIKKYTEEFLSGPINQHKNRILVLGSKTGGINFELLDSYDEVYGLGQTCFYFRIPVEMMAGKTIRYEVREEGDIFSTKKITKNLEAINCKIEKGEKSLKFYQTDYYNEISPTKYGKFDAILLYMVDEKEVDGLSLLPCLGENTLVFVMTPKGKSISESQFPSNRFKKLNLINNTLNPKEHKILFRETARKHRLELYEMFIYKVEDRSDAYSYYETDSLCEQYIRFHFASYETFPTTCGKKCIEILEKLNIKKEIGNNGYKNALDLGCAVGQTSFYLAEKFQKVNGVDYSKRFIEIADERTNMLGLKNVNFFHGSALELGKINLPKNNALVFCGNLIDRLDNPSIFLNDIANYVEKGGVLILTSPYTWLENFTPKENWVGGYVSNAEIMSTTKGLEIALKDNFELHSFEDVEFLIPDTPPFMYQLTAAQMTVWIRK